MGFYFYPRGGSAHACRSIATELGRNGIDVTLLAGSRSDIGEHGAAREFFAGADLRPVDFTPALCSDDPLGFDGGPGTAPMHASYEDRPAAEDPVMAGLGRQAYERQVDAWASELELASADPVDLLYLHHLTPLNEAAARVLPDTPVIGQIHGSELLMLERIARGIPAGWAAATTWAERLCDWAAGCTRIVVSSPRGLRRASTLLDIDPERFVRRTERLRRQLRAPGHRPCRALAPQPDRAASGVGSGQPARERRLRGVRPCCARRNGPAERRPLHRGQTVAAPDRGLRRGPDPIRRAHRPGPARRLSRRVGGRASARRDRTLRRAGCLPRRLALACGVAGLHQRQRRPRARVGQRTVRSGPGRGDGVRAAGDRCRSGRARRHSRPRRHRLADTARRPRGAGRGDALRRKRARGAPASGRSRSPRGRQALRLGPDRHPPRRHPP